MPTHRILTTYDIGDGSPKSIQTLKTAEAETNLDVAIASDADGYLVNCAIDTDQVKAVLLYSDVDLLLYVNADEDETQIALTGGVPKLWYVGGAGSNPIVEDVTAFYVDNTSDPATAGTLNIRVLQDPTP